MSSFALSRRPSSPLCPFGFLLLGGPPVPRQTDGGLPTLQRRARADGGGQHWRREFFCFVCVLLVAHTRVCLLLVKRQQAAEQQLPKPVDYWRLAAFVYCHAM